MLTSPETYLGSVKGALAATATAAPCINHRAVRFWRCQATTGTFAAAAGIFETTTGAVAAAACAFAASIAPASEARAVFAAAGFVIASAATTTLKEPPFSFRLRL